MVLRSRILLSDEVRLHSNPFGSFYGVLNRNWGGLMRRITVGVAANIGAGKSTLVERLQMPPLCDLLLNALPTRTPREHVHVFPEHFNPDVLAAFYSDPKRYALTAQLEFFNGRLARQSNIATAQGIVLEDRTLAEDYHIFGKAQRIMGSMSEAEFLAYQRTFDLMTEKVVAPDVMIFLRADIATLQSRIEKRGRVEEKTIPTAYLDVLNGLYEEFISHHVKCPVIVVDANVDFDDNERYFSSIAERLVFEIKQLKVPYTTSGLSEWVALPEVEATHRAIYAERVLKEYLREHPSLISLAGNVGLGKSTLTQILQGSLELEGLYENPLNNPLLMDFLGDKKKHAYDLQLHFLEMRSEQRRLAKSNGSSYVKDRSIPEDYLIFSRFFEKEGHLTSTQLDLLSTAFHARCNDLPQADLLVTLTGSPRLAWNRILERNRAAEVEGGWTYREIDAMSKLYATYAHDVVNFGFHKGPVLEIDVDQVNCLNRIHTGYICSQIYEKLSGKKFEMEGRK